MKSIIRKSAPMLIALLPLLTACQSEPEVGDTLYPTEKENYGPKAYINESSDNTTKLDVVETPVSLIVPEDTYTFYVKLTKPVETDVEIAVAENAEKAGEYSKDISVMPAGSIALNTKVVKIPAGEIQSAEPVEITVPESDAVRNLTGKGVVAISLTEVSGNNSVKIGSNYNTYYVVINKKVTNFKGQLLSELKEKTQIANSDYTITFQNGDVTAMLSDGDYGYGSSIYAYGANEVLIEFTKPMPFVGLSFNPSNYFPSYYSPKLVEIFTSNDGQKWTSQTGGEYTNTVQSTNCEDDAPFLLYAPVTCKYVKFAVYETFYYYPHWYLAEMKLYQ